MTDMIERVARAIYAAQTDRLVTDELWAICRKSSDFRDNLFYRARAAIAAMRDVDRVAIDCALLKYHGAVPAWDDDYDWHNHMREAINAALDAALECSTKQIEK